MKQFKYNLFLLFSIFAAVICGVFAGQYLMSPDLAKKFHLPPTNVQLTSNQNNNTGDTVAITTESLPSVVTIQATSPNSFYFSSPQTQNIGSGFVIGSNGFIATSKHVIADPTYTYAVVTNDNKTYQVGVIYPDPSNDVAILQINATGLKPLKLGDSSSLALGQSVIAIGTPLGQFNNSVTAGIVSGLNRSITASSPSQSTSEQLNGLIQTDAPISPGNSGGPLLNMSGQVIGINTAQAVSGQNIAFAIPINAVEKFMSTIK